MNDNKNTMPSAALPGPKRDRCNLRTRLAYTKSNFGIIGGLSHHIKLLREIIILPLLYRDLYSHFNIKPPRGVIFYGPPGTGKTLVAGALANEINKEAGGKVSFYQRKGADILDKWVGESERKLRELFNKAHRTRPSVIFFDELDGLAPERSNRNDQVHSSVVATLLALMDGLDDSSGVVVIGATNRIESVDPALRRPGRFDRELYFPLPNTVARKEIFQVHTKTWKHKPNTELLNELADSTSGCCGSDLQAICAEAVLCCLKRKYPDISNQAKLDIDLDSLKIGEEDFYQARANITPTSQRFGVCKMRKLTPFIKPLLQSQFDKIIAHIEVLLPHFLNSNKKYVIGSDRYAGRLILKGTTQQGLNTYLIPALLQRFEHIQGHVLDMPENYTVAINNALQNLPSILVLSRVDEWWALLDESAQMSIISLLQDIHAGLPILLIVTFNGELPPPLHSHFVYNSSIFIEVENPTTEEREQFFCPLLFGRKCLSLWRVLHGDIPANVKKDVNDGRSNQTTDDEIVDVDNLRPFVPNRHHLRHHSHGRHGHRDISKRQRYAFMPWYARTEDVRHQPRHKPAVWRHDQLKSVYSTAIKELVQENKNERCSNAASVLTADLEMPGTSKVQQGSTSSESVTLTKITTADNMSKRTSHIAAHEVRIHKLWKHIAYHATRDLPVVHLELLYDALLACIFINTGNFSAAFKGVQNTLLSFENISAQY